MLIKTLAHLLGCFQILPQVASQFLSDEQILENLDFITELNGLDLLSPRNEEPKLAEADPEPFLVGAPSIEVLKDPTIAWQEGMNQVAASACSFLLAQNPLCTQAPFS